MIKRDSPKKTPPRDLVWVSGIHIEGLHPGGSPSIRLQITDGYADSKNPAGFVMVESSEVTLGSVYTQAEMRRGAQLYSDLLAACDDLVITLGGEIGSPVLDGHELAGAVLTVKGASTVERRGGAQVSAHASCTAAGTVI